MNFLKAIIMQINGNTVGELSNHPRDDSQTGFPWYFQGYLIFCPCFRWSSATARYNSGIVVDTWIESFFWGGLESFSMVLYSYVF